MYGQPHIPVSPHLPELQPLRTMIERCASRRGPGNRGVPISGGVRFISQQEQESPRRIRVPHARPRGQRSSCMVQALQRESLTAFQSAHSCQKCNPVRISPASVGSVPRSSQRLTATECPYRTPSGQDAPVPPGAKVLMDPPDRSRNPVHAFRATGRSGDGFPDETREDIHAA